MWTCPQCGEDNPAGAAQCEVCAQSRPEGEPPAPARVAPARPAPMTPAPMTPAPEQREWPAASAPSFPAPAIDDASPPEPSFWSASPPEPASGSAPPFAAGSPEERFAAGSPEEESFPAAPRAGHLPPVGYEVPAARQRRVLWAAGAAVVAVAVAGVLVIPRLLGDDPGPAPAIVAPPATTTLDPAATPTTPAGTTPAETTPAETTPIETEPTATEPAEPTPADPAEPAGTSLVAVDPGVADDRSTAVAGMFETYFGGINAKDYDRVGNVLDPAGSINPADPAEMRDLAAGTRSTQDSDVSLNNLSDLAGGLVRADVTFVSRQDPGDGPKGRTGETCTRWSVAYTLSHDGDSFRVRKSKASSSPC